MSPSFAYVYDGILAQAAGPKILARVEAEVARLGIQGPVLRDGFHDLATELKETLRQGVKNLIFVGSDPWFLRWIPWIAEQEGLSVGYLPSEPSVLGKALGIPAAAAGVGVLAARVIRVLDLGSANGRPFLLEAVALKTSARVELEGSYAVRARTPSPLSIQNLALDPKTGRTVSVPQDGFLEAVIQTTNERPALLGLWKKTDTEETRIVFASATVRDERDQAVSFTVDGQPLKAREVAFRVLPNAASFIVGPDRTF